MAGPAPYWTDWTFDKLGNRRTETSHAATGDTLRTYGYPLPGPNVVRPHAMTSLKTSVNGSETTVGFDYDATGNMTSRPVASGIQTLSWDAEDALSTAVDGTHTTGYLYGANGERLIRRDSSGTTVYLPGMEITKPAGAAAAVATRHYSFAGRVIASRTGAGLEWLFTDHQGTELTSVNNATQKVTVRRQTPYGAARDPQPGPWVNNTGFVGGMTEPTGLTHLGARDYDPALGRFVSVDPLLDLADPQQWNGYAYANNSPISNSDPSGLIPSDCREADCYGYSPGRPGDKTNPGGCPYGCGTPRNVTWGKANHLSSSASNTAANRYTGRTQDGRPYPDKAKSEQWTPEYFSEFFYNQTLADAWPNHAALTDMCNDIQVGCAYLAQSSGINKGALLDGLLTLPLILAGPELIAGCAVAVIACATDALDTAAGFYGRGSLVGSGTGVRLLTSGCSFTADTQVLMADRHEKPIADVRIGDKLLATDPETGKTTHQEVAALHKNLDHQLTDLTIIDTAGVSSTIRTTPNHPFWDTTTHRWTPAGDLRPTDVLHAPRGNGVRVGKVQTFTADAHMYNLTVNNLHTYYVFAGNTPVLVHNVGCGPASFYRGARGGGPSFVPKPNDYKVDPTTGFVKETHGVSLFNNAGSIESRGFEPHGIDPASVPSTLRVIQRGRDLEHFEIVPAPGANLTPARYGEELSKIRCMCDGGG